MAGGGNLTPSSPLSSSFPSSPHRHPTSVLPNFVQSKSQSPQVEHFPTVRRCNLTLVPPNLIPAVVQARHPITIESLKMWRGPLGVRVGHSVFSTHGKSHAETRLVSGEQSCRCIEEKVCGSLINLPPPPNPPNIS